MLKDERDALWAENTSLRERIGLLTTDYENMRFENHWMKQYILLTDVARASLAELANDYLNWLMLHGQAPAHGSP